MRSGVLISAVSHVVLVALALLGTPKLFDNPELASIEDKLKAEMKYTQRHPPPVSLWDNWLMLGLLIFLYSLDVGLRRLTGLS